MKKSLGLKLTSIFLASLLGILVLTTLITNVFLPRYYVSKSEKKLILLYDDLNNAAEQDKFGTDEYDIEIEKECQSWNISAYVVDTDGETYISTNAMEGILKGSLLNHIFEDGSQEIHVRNSQSDSGESTIPPDQSGNEAPEDATVSVPNGQFDMKETDISDKISQNDSDNTTDPLENNQNKAVEPDVYDFNDPVDDSISGKTVIKETENYTLSQVSDIRTGSDYLEMWGSLANGCEFILRTPLEGMALNAILANQFLIYVGIGVAVFGSVLILIVSSKITRPIKELTLLSAEMADLNFEKQYTGKRQDEIGVLGHNYNKMSKSLEKSISELKAANMRLQKDIENKNKLEEMRSDFIGNVSHELKTPIAIIQGYAEGLKEGLNDPDFDRESYCDIIIDEAGKMNHMVMNLLSLNELEFGENRLDITRFDISEMIEGICQINSENSIQNGIILDKQTMDSIYVWGDAFKIEEVLTNYTSNAIHYATTSEEYEKPFISIRTTECGDKIRISVFNSGKNIPENDIERIWEKFYKVDKAHTREYGGNGIGLSIVKAIMDAHNQKFGVTNEPGGVTFWFELDMA